MCAFIVIRILLSTSLDTLNWPFLYSLFKINFFSSAFWQLSDSNFQNQFSNVFCFHGGLTVSISGTRYGILMKCCENS